MNCSKCVGVARNKIATAIGMADPPVERIVDERVDVPQRIGFGQPVGIIAAGSKSAKSWAAKKPTWAETITKLYSRVISGNEAN